MKSLIFLIATLFLFACGHKPHPLPPVPPAPPPAPPPVPQPLFKTGLVKKLDDKMGVLHFSPQLKLAPFPDNYDWRLNGGETPVRDQGPCGSCWAFGSTQELEGGYKIWQKKDIDFSEQELVGNLFSGCGGGNFAQQYQVTHGQTDEASCPYHANNSKCPSSAKPVGKPLGGGYLGQSNRSATVDEIKQAILTYGPVGVTVCGGVSSFQSIRDIGPHSAGSACSTDHIVVLVGWMTTSDGKTAWLVKNSWGLTWGKGGYSYLVHGSYRLAEDSHFLSIEHSPCEVPYLRLPKKFVIGAGDTVVIAADNISGVTYAWYLGQTKLSDTWYVKVENVTQNETLMLKVKHQCGEGEIPTQLQVATK